MHSHDARRALAVCATIFAAAASGAGKAEESRPPSAAIGPPAAAPLKTSRTSTRVWSDAERATRACTFNGKEFRCDAALLQRFNIEEVVEISATTSTTSVAGVPRDLLFCTRSVELSMHDPTGTLTVDWARVAYVIDGVAVQAVPGRTRRLNAELQLRPSSAPPGAKLIEEIYPITEQCLRDTSVSDRFNGDVVDLVVPFQLEGASHTARVARTRRWVSVTEAEAMRLLPIPPIAPKPREPRPLGGGSFPVVGWTLLGTIAGVVGCLGAMGASVAIAYNNARTSATESAARQAAACVGCCAFYPSLFFGILVCVPCIGLDLGFGGVWAARQGSRAGLLAQWDAYEWAIARRAAFEKRMAELNPASRCEDGSECPGADSQDRRTDDQPEKL